MRSLRSAFVSGWVVLVLLATAGFAAFSIRDGSGGTAESEVAAAPAALATEPATARVSAFLLAESLAFGGSLPERAAPPAAHTQMGPDGLTATPLTVGATTTTTEPPTTTTAAPTTTTAAPPTTAAAEAATTTTHTHAPTTTAAPTTTTTTAPPESTTTSTTVPEDTTSTTAASAGGVERWRGLVAAYFPAERVEEALRVMHCESKGDPNARNPHSGAAGLFQFMARTWGWASAEAGFGGASVYDPEANIASAAWLVQHSIATGHAGGAWGHWTCKP